MAYTLDVTNADCYEGTTALINKLGIKDETELNSCEALITAYKAASLINEPLAHNFGFEDYKRLHRVLFEELYNWAGQPRTIALSKTATVFIAPEKIEELGTLIFARLKKMDYFTKLPQGKFIAEATDLYHSLNMLHPFREGNTRTTITFCCQYADEIGLNMNREIFEKNSRYVRTALVAYNAYFADGSNFSKKEYLERIVYDAISG